MVGSGPSKKRPLVYKEDDKIRVFIQGQDGYRVEFAIKRNLQLKKLLMKYCENKKLDYPSMRFIYNNSKLPVRSTPAELHMEDGEQIDAMTEGHAG